MDRFKNEPVHRTGIEKKLVGIVDSRVLRWFGQMKSMGKYHNASKMLIVKVKGRCGVNQGLVKWIV